MSLSKLLILTPDFAPGAGGIQHLLTRLCELVPAAETRVVTRAADGAPRHDAGFAAARVRRSAVPFGSHRASLAALDVAARAEIRRFSPDVILVGHVVSAPATWGRAARGIPTVLYLHADEVPAHSSLSRASVRRATRTIAVSRHTAALALEHGAASERLRIVPPGVDLATTTAAPAAERAMIVTVARLEDPYKGHDVMLRAMPLILQHVPDARWTVVGDGSLRTTLARTAEELGVSDAVHFAGRVDDAERDRLLSAARVFAMPSRMPPNGGGEGFGIAFMEASARGLPVVAGRVGGALDAIVDGQTGLLVDPEDPSAVAEAIVKLLSDVKLARALGTAGAARASDFAWPRIAMQVTDVLEEALASKGVPRAGS